MATSNCQSPSETLEEVHLASEAADAATVRACGRVYLQETGPVVD